MMKKNACLKSRAGSALMVVVILTGVMMVTVAALMRYSLTERRLNMRSELWLESRNASEALVEHGFAQLRYKFDNRTNVDSDAMDPESTDALQLPAAGTFNSAVDTGSLELVGGVIPPMSSTLTYIDPNDPDNEYDPLKGKMVRAREVSVFGKATVNDGGGRSSITTRVTQRLQIRDTPLFAHAIFYNLDLEFHPGPEMDVYGPVHTNGNLYVKANRSLEFHDQVTTAGHMLREFGYSDSTHNGDVYFRNAAGDPLSMKIDDIYMDSTLGTGEITDDFRTFATARWDGYLKTSMHDVSEYLPVAFEEYEPDDPDTGAYDPVNTGRQIIEPPVDGGDQGIESQKMANKAGLYLKWNVATKTLMAYKKDGTVLDISELKGGGSNKLWKVRENAFIDRRRNTWVDVVDINVGKLKQLIESPDTEDPLLHISGYTPSDDWNGIVYLESYNSAGATLSNDSGVRLWGGETDRSNQGIPNLGEDPGLSFATNNCLYVRGNFNADGDRHQEDSSNHSALVPEDGEVPVAVMGETVTFLSKDWDDDYWDDSDNHGSKPTADHTEVAAAIVSGLVPSNAHDNNISSGGAHNFPRFLEDWGDKDFFVRGAMVCLYETKFEDSTYNTSYYSAPNRKWGFSNQYKNGTYPPGTPMLRTYRRLDYRELSPSNYAAAIAELPWNVAEEDE